MREPVYVFPESINLIEKVFERSSVCFTSKTKVTDPEAALRHEITFTFPMPSHFFGREHEIVIEKGDPISAFMVDKVLEGNTVRFSPDSPINSSDS
jgi:hypothetical protein